MEPGAWNLEGDLELPPPRTTVTEIGARGDGGVGQGQKQGLWLRSQLNRLPSRLCHRPRALLEGGRRPPLPLPSQASERAAFRPALPLRDSRREASKPYSSLSQLFLLTLNFNLPGSSPHRSFININVTGSLRSVWFPVRKAPPLRTWWVGGQQGVALPVPAPWLRGRAPLEWAGKAHSREMRCAVRDAQLLPSPSPLGPAGKGLESGGGSGPISPWPACPGLAWPSGGEEGAKAASGEQVKGKREGSGDGKELARSEVQPTSGKRAPG